MHRIVSRYKLNILVSGFVVIAGLTTFVVSAQSTDTQPIASNAKTNGINTNSVDPMPNSETELLAEQPTDDSQNLSVLPAGPDPNYAAMPAAGADNYGQACKDAKASDSAEYDRRMAEENATHEKYSQGIMNYYSRDGMSFSKAKKSAQSKEDDRHKAAKRQIEADYRQQQKALDC